LWCNEANIMDKLLSEIYYNPSKGFCGGTALLKQARLKYPKLKKSQVIEWLSKQPTYSVHKPARRTYPRNKVIVSSIDEQWQADLVDLQSLEKYNDGFKYLLTCIDLFSKFAWAIPLKSKVSDNVKNAFITIFKTGRKPYKLQTDKGTEFVNKEVQKFLKSEDVDFFTTNSEMKASVVERFNRTLKEKMWKYFTHRNTYRYIDILTELLINYNNSYHRTIKMAPSKVNSTNENEILNKVFRIKDSKLKFKFKIGDEVRINKLKRTFEKGYTPNWTEEIFIISDRYRRSPPVYVLKDLLDDPIEGIFYEYELQKVQTRKKELYIIEKILKTRKNKGKIEHFVKWRGYPAKFNSWVTDLAKV